ncbi:DUF742 domain-containing protein [Actinokineospora fastidiosa]|uniref:DUF742 domain-containing protein n=1 Tax=Actinokineospora fastidiosa TaxID=1816 RepID=UPI001E4CE917|nr:DUF742 domain-containing protein [Actinokineospora fastidiosa]
MVQKTVVARSTQRARGNPEVGNTGARFGPQGPLPAAEVDPVLAEPPAADSPIGLTGARFGRTGRKRKREARKADPAPVADAWWDADTPVETGEDHWTDEYADWLTRPESHALVRPYAWTRGRTRARGDLAIEALVHTVRLDARTSWSSRAITELCRTPRSVAEVAALLSVPLGVARVLIADLAAAGVVRVHATPDGVPDLTMLNRVLTGLRRL